MAARKRAAAKKSSAAKSAASADPHRETITVSHGPNGDGLAHQVAAAHAHSPATDAEVHRAAELDEPAAPASSGGDAGKEV